MSGAATPERVEALCDAAGMAEDDPLRASIVSVARSAQRLEGAAERIGKEAGRQAAGAAAGEMRAAAKKLLLEVGWAKRLAVAGLAAVAAAGGWWSGRQMPQATFAGRLTPAQAETLRWNDLGPLLAGCQRQAAQGGREWCQFTGGWWLSPPGAPK